MAGAEEDVSSRNFLVRLLLNHWTVKPVVKSTALEEREKYLFLYWKGIRFNRWMLFISALIIQFCCGSLYSWSNFNAPIDILIYGTKTANKAPNTFYIAIGMFGTTSMIMGPWVERHGPRRGLMLGSVVFAIGQAIASFSLHRKSIAGLYVGYGVLGGFGLGINYISPVSALQKFFPDYRGVASGFAVAGFGAGSIVWSKVYLPLIKAYKLPETFAILGAILSGSMLASTIFMRTPPNNFTVAGLHVNGEKVVHHEDHKVGSAPDEEFQNNGNHGIKALENGDVDVEKTAAATAERRSVIKMTLLQSISSPDFAFMYLMFFANQLFGLVALSRLSNMAQDLFGQTRSEGANLVSINGVFNCLGRLLLPTTADFFIKTFNVNPPFTRKCVFCFNLVAQVIIVSILPHLINHNNYDGFRAVMWTLTFAYGGGFGTIPCFLTDMFGPYNIGALHGMILTAWSIGGVGGGLGFTHLFDRHKPAALPASQSYPPGAFDKAYESNFHWILGVVIFGLVMLFFVRTDPDDRRAPGWRYSIFGKKIIHLKSKNSVQTEN